MKIKKWKNSLRKKKNHVTGKTNVKYNLYTVLVIVEEMDIDEWCHHPSFIK